MKQNCVFVPGKALAVSALALAAAAGTALGDVIYVDPAATGLPTGNSWTNAYRMLWVALAAADDGDEVWIASGRYTPLVGGWDLNAGAALYGGFTPGATSLEDRDPVATPTVLDADVNNDDAAGFLNRGDNRSRVLTVAAPGGSVRLDGLVVRGCEGWAGVEIETAAGVTVEGCLFRENRRTEAIHPPAELRITAYGGGLLIGPGVPTASVLGCVFEDNLIDNTEVNPANDLGSLGGGAGLASFAAHTLIEDCVFRDNTALFGRDAFGAGAGVFSETSEIRRSEFTGNAAMPAGSGGGLIVSGPAFSTAQSVVVESCRFEDNAVGGGTAASSGGGARLIADVAQVASCDFIANSSASNIPQGISVGGGGGLGIDRYRLARVVGCRVLGNNAGPSLGGGLSLISGDSDDEAHIENCLVAGNSALRAGGVFLGFTLGGRGGGAVVNSTIAHNAATLPTDTDFDGGGLVFSIAQDAPAAVHNTILWGNTNGASTDQEAQIAVNLDFPPMLSIRRNLIEGWDGSLGGVGNAGDDPLFIEPNGSDGVPGTADDNYRLDRFSPAIDAGGNGLLSSDDLDLDQDGITAESLPFDLGGETRRIDDIDTPDTGAGASPLVDIGAYEFQRRSCPSDLNSDGILDLADIGLFVGGFPSQTPETDLNGDGIWDLADLNIFVSVFTAGCGV